MRAAERVFAAIARGERVTDPEAATYFGPMARVARRLRRPFDPAVLVLARVRVRRQSRSASRRGGSSEDRATSCSPADSTTSPSSWRPGSRRFAPSRRRRRLGHSGSTATVWLSARARRCSRSRGPDARPSRAIITGFGLASDAVHLTAPDREGGGLARAASAALAEAGSSVDRSRERARHGHAVQRRRRVPGARPRAGRRGGARRGRAPVQGADRAHAGGRGRAGAARRCRRHRAGRPPGGGGRGDGSTPDAPARLLEQDAEGRARGRRSRCRRPSGAPTRLSSSAAERPAAASRPDASRLRAPGGPRRSRAGRRAPGRDRANAAWTDCSGRIRSCGWRWRPWPALEASSGPLAGAGVVVGTALATLETNALFAARIRERGARAAEPRRFPYTSPERGGRAVLDRVRTDRTELLGRRRDARGPRGAGLRRRSWSKSGDADRIVVVAVDDVRSATRALAGGAAPWRGRRGGARQRAPDGGARARIGAIELRRGAGGDRASIRRDTSRCGRSSSRGCPPSSWRRRRPTRLARVVLHPV